MKSILKSRQWLHDLNDTLNIFPDINELQGKSVLITGITGLIGSAIADLFIRYNETHKQVIHILAAARDRSRLEKRFSEYVSRDYFRYVPFDASGNSFNCSFKADYIIHCASNAYPSAIIREPVETMKSNFSGTLLLLTYAKEYGTKRFLLISSSEVYGKKTGMDSFSETEYGWIDLLNARNSYSIGKRAAETLCVSFSEEYGIETVIARPGHIYGPTATEKDNRVSSMWAYDASRGKNLIMKSDGLQLRSYCHCLDCATAILKILLHGENKQAYNISNPDSIITIKEMAELLAGFSGVQLVKEKASDAEKGAFNPMSNSSLESKKLEDLGWKGRFSAETGFSHTVLVLKEVLAQEDGPCLKD